MATARTRGAAFTLLGGSDDQGFGDQGLPIGGSGITDCRIRDYRLADQGLPIVGSGITDWRIRDYRLADQGFPIRD
jgi:hypothetical protein